MIKNCSKCNKEFKTNPSSIKRGWGKFCSISCSNSTRKIPKEVGRKISEAHKKSGHKPPVNRGNKSNFWKGGITEFKNYNILYPNQWTETLRRSIRERDNYICQICNKMQGDYSFDIHHIDYDKNNCNPSNLVALCRSCHIKTNFNRNKWVGFFKH